MGTSVTAGKFACPRRRLRLGACRGAGRGLRRCARAAALPGPVADSSPGYRGRSGAAGRAGGCVQASRGRRGVRRACGAGERSGHWREMQGVCALCARRRERELAGCQCGWGAAKQCSVHCGFQEGGGGTADTSWLGEVKGTPARELVGAWKRAAAPAHWRLGWLHPWRAARARLKGHLAGRGKSWQHRRRPTAAAGRAFTAQRGGEQCTETNKICPPEPGVVAVRPWRPAALAARFPCHQGGTHLRRRMVTQVRAHFREKREAC
jgi:hypothetical protein